MSDLANNTQITDSSESIPQRRNIRILQITDSHFLAEAGGTMLGVDTEASFKDTLEAALRNETRPDLAMFTGDLVQDATSGSYRRLKKVLSVIDFPCYCLPGNHDEQPLMGREMCGNGVYCQPQILLDGWQILCLDSTIPNDPGGRLLEEEIIRLETLLDALPNRWAMVALHHHPVPSGSVWMDTMLLENAGRFLSILAARPQVRVVLFGHVHQLMDTTLGHIRLLGSPSTCFQFKPGSVDFALDAVPAGYRWIELKPDGNLETRVERLQDLPAGLDFTCPGYA